MAGRTAIWKTRGASADAPLLHLEIADSFFRRFIGLMGRKSIAPSHALLIIPCTGVQMSFMRFVVDVAFLKRGEDAGEWQVIRVVHNLRPWLGVSVCSTADAALEMGQGELERFGIEPGTILEETRRDE